VSECRNGAVNTFYVHPADVGLAKAATESLKGGDARENAAIIAQVLGGERGPARDVVLFNAGAALFIADEAGSLEEGLARAAKAIDDGDARRTLERMVSVSLGDGPPVRAGA